MKSTHSLLLASTALFAVTVALPPVHAAILDQPLIVAQAQAPAGGEPPPRARQQEQRQQERPAQPHVQAPAQPARPVQPQAQKPAPAATPAAQSNPPAAAQPKQPERPAAQTAPERREQRHEQKPAQAPAAKPAAPAAQQPAAKPLAPAAQQPAAKPATPTAQQPPARAGTPAAQQPPAKPGVPAAQERRGAAPAPTAQQPGAKPAAPTAQQPAPAANTAAERQPPKPHDANEFIRRDNKQPARGMEDVRRERQEVREGNRTVIREGTRTIVRENNRVIIRHSEVDRFTVGARNVRVDRRGGNTETVIEQANGVRIVNITGPDGRLIRRIRRGPDGRDVIIINNVYTGPRAVVFIELPPPVIRIPQDRYILVADRATPAMIYDVFMEPPVERIEHRYTLDQVRYSAPLRDRMPRVDLDINFETGSWQLTPEQVGKLSAIAEGLNRAIKANPAEVFLIEGHTDAVGSPEDNLSLSDRRAESVAVALTEQFQVPAENLVTQGYGEEGLKVQTQEAERANRRVAVRRITPLIDQAQK